ncbi:amine sulfotransferase-like [Watersipora subatra]|uniref:amine sulfotransferase-like n=1 Tax=Watersipora subatra TaxID=2589382 RepID=UPI00355C8EB8
MPPLWMMNYILMVLVAIRRTIARTRIFLGWAKEKYGTLEPFVYKGFLFSPIIHTMERLKACEKYNKFRPGDIMVSTYPKAGTNFVLDVIVSIYKEKGLLPKDKISMELVAQLELQFLALVSGSTSEEEALNWIEDYPDPRIVKTHLPWNMFPADALEGKVKVIHCYRNPKDVCSSMFAFYKRVAVIFPSTTWSQFVQWFIEGNVVGGSYFQFLKTWYPYRNNPGVLNLRFEDMKQDLKGNVIKITEFLDLELSPQQIDAVVVANTFANKKKEMGSHNPIYRRGKSGGWKSDLTVDQNEMMDEWIQQEMEGLEGVKIAYD